MLRLLVCVSGGGTNLQAIFDAIDAGKIRNAEIAAVISNNPGAYALERARQHNVEAICLSPKSFESREAFNHVLTEKVKEIAPDLIVLAGFLVAVPAEMIEAFPNQIINIHPSLIPAFCGVGFYGLHVHEGVLARGAKVTGATCILWTAEWIPVRLSYRRRLKCSRAIHPRVCSSGSWRKRNGKFCPRPSI